MSRELNWGIQKDGRDLQRVGSGSGFESANEDPRIRPDPARLDADLKY